MSDMLAEPDPPVPPLFGIISTPQVAGDGSVDCQPGYKPSLRKLYLPTPGFVMRDVSDTPSPEDVATAVQLIHNDLFEGFPFRDRGDFDKHERDTDQLVDPSERRMLYGQSSRANATAALLTPFASSLFEGPTPAFLLNKTQPRTGASKLADAINRLVYGRPMHAHPLPESDAEWRKQIATLTAAAAQMAVFDNVNDVLRSGALAGAISATWWADRELGSNRLISGPVGWVWMFTGNN